MPKRPTAPLEAFCRTLPGVTEDVKWVDNLCFSVGAKLFAAFDAEAGAWYAFKCDEDDFDRLTEIDGIIPAPYSARFGWVRVQRPGALKSTEARSLLRKAHALVAAGLTKKKQRELGLLG